MMVKPWLIVMIIAMLLVAGCDSGPSQEYAVNEPLVNESFDQPDAWENYISSQYNVNMYVGDGVYHVFTGENSYAWTLNDQTHTDVVIEVDTLQTSSFEDNGYGVMCRADSTNNGDGYYFLISGDGFFTIRRGEGESVTSIIDWKSSGAINKGQAHNTIRAVCIDDYLALYVNNKFLGEAHDSTYRSGNAGIAAIVAPDAQTSIDFDNFKIWRAVLGSAPIALT